MKSLFAFLFLTGFVSLTSASEHQFVANAYINESPEALVAITIIDQVVAAALYEKILVGPGVDETNLENMVVRQRGYYQFGCLKQTVADGFQYSCTIYMKPKAN